MFLYNGCCVNYFYCYRKGEIMKKSIGRLVSILYRKNQIYLNAALKPLDITAAELPILLHLYNFNHVSQEELSTYLMIDKAATARGVQSLIKKGYIKKEKDPNDRRAYQVYLTESAIAIKHKIYEKLDAWTQYLTEGLDDRSVAIMFDVLDAMVRKVEATDLKEIGRTI